MQLGFRKIGERDGSPIVVSEKIFEEVKRCLPLAEAELRKPATFDDKGEPVGVYGVQVYDDEEVFVPDPEIVEEEVAPFAPVSYKCIDEVSFP